VVETITASSSAEVRAALRSNTVNVPGSSLFARARAGEASRLDLEATNNSFSSATGPIDTVDLGTTGSAFGCAALSGNLATGSPQVGFYVWLLNEAQGSTFVLEGTQSNASAQLTSTNSGAPVFVSPGVGITSTNACRRPTN
jgi:hypothetical protein